MFHDITTLRCRWCTNRIVPYRRDINSNPIHDDLCVACFMKHMKTMPQAQVKPARPATYCNRCMVANRLPGFGWCGVCALKYQEYRLAEGEEPVIVEQSIAAIKLAISRSFAGNTNRQG